LFIAVIATATLLGLAATGGPAQASITPGPNGKIAYLRDDVDSFTINPDGSQDQPIGPAGSTTCNTWSPDGGKLLCNVWSPQDVPQPATANPDGSGFTLLNPNLPLDLFCLSWSPDGKRLLCHSEGMANPADAGLYTVRSSDAGGLVRVSATPPNGFDNGYGYSPDGSRILFAAFGNNHGTLFSVKPDGSGKLRLSPAGLSVIDLGFFDRVGADWSPNGSQVAFAAQKVLPSGRNDGAALFTVKADGTGLRQITPSAPDALSAQWSPNGHLIAFSSSGRPQAWVVRPDGTGLTEVTSPASGYLSLTPVWSPDSTKLLLNRVNTGGQTSLWTANTDGSGLTKLTDTAQPGQCSWGTAPVG
jgi:Tol biopolymer transport system component